MASQQWQRTAGQAGIAVSGKPPGLTSPCPKAPQLCQAAPAHIQDRLPGAQLLGVQSPLAAVPGGGHAERVVLAVVSIRVARLKVYAVQAGAVAGAQRGPHKVERQEGKEQAESQALGRHACMLPRCPHGTTGLGARGSLARRERAHPRRCTH